MECIHPKSVPKMPNELEWVYQIVIYTVAIFEKPDSTWKGGRKRKREERLVTRA